jgi:hypothetical protein
MADDTDIEITETTTVTVHIHAHHSRNSAVQPVTVNGQLTNIPVGVDHPVSPEVANALKDSGIAHTIVSQPSGDAGAASGVEGSSPEAAAPAEPAPVEPEAPASEDAPAEEALPEQTAPEGASEIAEVPPETSAEEVTQPESSSETVTQVGDETPVAEEAPATDGGHETAEAAQPEGENTAE